MKKLLVIVVSVIYILSVISFGKLFLADVNYKSARKELAKGNSTDAIKYAEKAITLNPNEPAYYRERAKALIGSTLNQDEKVTSKLKQWALNNLETSYKLNPQNLATIRNNVPTYYFLAVKDLSAPNGLDNLDPVYLPISSNFVEKNKEYSPTDVGIYVLMAKYEKRLGLEEEYNSTVKSIKKLRPDLLEWHPDLIN